MTGQVKEEILTRLGELGVSVQRGALCFAPSLLRRDEFLAAPGEFEYIDVAHQPRTVSLPSDSLAFTVCQTPVVYVCGERPTLQVTLADGQIITLPDNCLDTGDF